MQKEQNFTYAVPINDKPKGESSTYRHPDSVKQLLTPPKDIKNLADVWDGLVKKFPENKLIEDMTYTQVDKIARSVGSWFVKNKHEKFFMYTKNTPEWTVIDISSWNYGTISIPLYSTLGSQAFDHILKLTEGTLIVVNAAIAENAVTNLGNFKGSVTTVLTFDELEQGHVQKFKDMGLNIVKYSEIIGHEELPRPEVSLKNHLTYAFTSGTTGLPKGVIQTHLMAVTQLMAMMGHFEFKETDIHISYLPVAHTFERVVIWFCIYFGSNVQYSKHPPTEILKDLAVIKPTILPIVPRLLNRLYPVVKKIYEAENNAQKIKEMFGGKLRLLVTGSAPVATEILKFFKKVLDCDIREGYGQTQTIAASFLTYEGDTNYGIVGGPNKSIEYKLVDVPEMNYSSDNDPPMGEVCERGASIFQGYYKDEQHTKQALDKDGWNHSGDVGTILPNGALKLLDRKKNIFKLSQGEYIAPEKIENIYLRCPFISQCFLYGDSLKDFNIAIVHPALDKLTAVAKELKIQEQDPKVLCDHEDVCKFILEKMNEQGKKDKLCGFELARKIKLYPVSLGTHGIYTGTMKLQRNEAKKAFKNDIDDLYKE